MAGGGGIHNNSIPPLKKTCQIFFRIKSVWKVLSHFEYVNNWLKGLDVTWQEAYYTCVNMYSHMITQSARKTLSSELVYCVRHFVDIYPWILSKWLRCFQGWLWVLPRGCSRPFTCNTLSGQQFYQVQDNRTKISQSIKLAELFFITRIQFTQVMV